MINGIQKSWKSNQLKILWSSSWGKNILFCYIFGFAHVFIMLFDRFVSSQAFFLERILASTLINFINFVNPGWEWRIQKPRTHPFKLWTSRFILTPGPQWMKFYAFVFVILKEHHNFSGALFGVPLGFFLVCFPHAFYCSFPGSLAVWWSFGGNFRALSSAFPVSYFSYLPPLFLMLFRFVVVPMLGFLCFACCHCALFVVVLCLVFCSFLFLCPD